MSVRYKESLRENLHVKYHYDIVVVVFARNVRDAVKVLPPLLDKGVSHQDIVVHVEWGGVEESCNHDRSNEAGHCVHCMGLEASCLQRVSIFVYCKNYVV